MKRTINIYKNEFGDIPKDSRRRFIELLGDKKIKDKEILEVRKKTKSILTMGWEEIRLVIYLEPKATPRPRISSFGTFYVKGAKINKNMFRDFMKRNRHLKTITTACKLTVDTYIPTKGMNRLDSILAELRMIRPLSKPDWDNLGKTYSDMIVGEDLLLLEDSIIIDGRTRKFYSSKPRVEISIKYQTKYDSKYNKRKVESWKTFKESGLEEKEHV